MRVFFSILYHCLQKRNLSKNLLTRGLAPPHRTTMTHFPTSRFIVCSLTVLFIFLGPVLGGGYAFDSYSCSQENQGEPPDIQALNLALVTEFLTFQMKRATMIAKNTGFYLTGTATAPVPQLIQDPLYKVMRQSDSRDENWYPALDQVRTVFTGGEIWTGVGSGLEPSSRNILGIASYTERLPNFDSIEPPENNDQDIEGNLVSVLVVSWRTVFAIGR